MKFPLTLLLSIPFLWASAQSSPYKTFSLPALLDSAEDAQDRSEIGLALNLLTEAKSRLKDNSPQEQWLQYYTIAGTNSFEIRKIPESKASFNKALELAQELNDSAMIATLYSKIANTLIFTGDFKESLKMYELALSYHPNKDGKSYNATTMNMGQAYLGLNQYDKALSLLLKAKDYYQEQEDYRNLAITENNIGEIYRTRIHDNEKAKTHYEKALKINKRIDNKIGLAQNYHNISAMYLDLKQPDSALSYALESKRLKELIGDEGGIASADFNLGCIYHLQGKLEKAITNFNQSLEISSKYQIMEGLFHNNLKLGQIHLELKEYRQSEENLLKALEVARQAGHLELLSDVNHALYDVYKEQGINGKALEYLEELIVINDSIDALDEAQNLDELRTKYEADLAEAENLALREKEKVQAINIASQQKLLYLTIGSIIMLLLAGIWLIKMLRQRNQALRSEKHGKAELELQHKKLQQSEIELLKSNDLKNKILSVLGHDLRNPLSNISTLLGSMTSASYSEEEFSKVFDYLKKQTETTLITLQEILAWARLQMNEEGMVIENIEASELISEIISLYDHSFKNKQISVKISAPEIYFQGDRNQMKSVFSNLISNALKFSKKGSKIGVDVSTNGDKIIFNITDSGMGLAPEVLENLNKRTKIISKTGTSGERGTGIGLRIVSDFIEVHNGTLNFKNNELIGATVTVVLPLKQADKG